MRINKGETMKKTNELKKNRLYDILYEKGVLYFVISFLIPAAIMTFAFRKAGIHPFGDEQMLVVDLWHQYYPFFRVVREKLLTGGSFLYSWQNGMGTNFLSLISYYAASPLNIFSVFFDEEHVRDALTFILIAKIGFCGAFFSCFLRYTFRRKDFSICIFSSMFALCSYMLGYYWNVMWFDTIALFPLVMTGVVAVCREKKWMTFTIALAVSLVSNYYIGYFTCIFTVFMFAAAVIIYAGSIKDFFAKLWIMARSAVIGIALGGFMLLPAYFGLQLTHSANNVFPADITFYEKWTDIFANLISYSEPATKEGLPNFACGMLAVVLMGVFLFSAGIKLREKISAVLMLAIIAVSCNMNVLNYIWHGFHFTNMIPYRFAFIFSFVLIAAAYRAYDVIMEKGIKLYQLPLMLIFPIVVFYLNYVTCGEEKFTLTKELKSSLIITAAFILIFVAVKIFPFKKDKVRNTVLSLFIMTAVISELWSNAALGVRTVGTSDYKSYPSNNDNVQELLEKAEKMDNPLFYRTEMTKTYTLNDSSLYGYYGISQFSSAANESVTRFIQRLGLYASGAGNRYYYRLSTPVVNSMLGLRYIISKDGTLRSEEAALSVVGSSQNCCLYKNNYPLSLGYMVNEDILDMNVESGYRSPFDFQNEAVKLCTGIDQPCFSPQPVALVSYDGLNVSKTSFGNYNFTKETSGDTNAYATYTFDGVEGGYLYGYASNGGCESVSVKNNGEAVDSNIGISDYPIVFPMGNVQAGETAKVTVKAKTDVDSGEYKLMAFALDQSVFEAAYEKLADEQLNITSFSDTKITGTVNALEDGVLMLTMPYEKGWSIYIDGEKAETFDVMGAMLGVRVTAGEHTIKASYIPEGFSAGCCGTAAGAAAFAVLVYLDKRKKEKTASEPQTAAESSGGDKPEHSEDAETEPEKPEPADKQADSEETNEES